MTDKEFDPSHVFHVGQEVVCVKPSFDQNQRTTLSSGLVEGNVYKIRWLGIYNHYLDGEYLGIKVEGIDRGICPTWGYVDQPFYANRFRPLVKDPLAVFRQIAADPDGYKPEAPEQPGRGKPVREGAPEREREEV